MGLLRLQTDFSRVERTLRRGFFCALRGTNPERFDTLHRFFLEKGTLFAENSLAFFRFVCYIVLTV